MNILRPFLSIIDKHRQARRIAPEELRTHTGGSTLRAPIPEINAPLIVSLKDLLKFVMLVKSFTDFTIEDHFQLLQRVEFQFNSVSMPFAANES